MRKVGLKMLKNKLSEYVRMASAGETVVITDRGRAVAQIVPPRPEPESMIERGVREGWIRPAIRGRGLATGGKPVPGLSFEQLMADLEQDREDRRVIYLDSSVALARLLFNRGRRPPFGGTTGVEPVARIRGLEPGARV